MNRSACSAIAAATFGMGVTGGVDGDAGGEVEVLLAVGRGDPAAVPLATRRGVTENHTFERCDVCVMAGMLRLSAPAVERVCGAQGGGPFAPATWHGAVGARVGYRSRERDSSKILPS